jgi:hypothetical protein
MVMLLFIRDVRENTGEILWNPNTVSGRTSGDLSVRKRMTLITTRSSFIM